MIEENISITCGIFLIDSLERILLVHPTNGRWNQWSIPKGLMEIGETFLESACREFLEETGLNIKELGYPFTCIGEAYYTSKKKKLIAFVCKIDKEIEFEFNCKSMVEENVDIPFPENDKAAWFSIDDTVKYVNPPQKLLLRKYKEGKNLDNISVV